jgi:hypothetical protein
MIYFISKVYFNIKRSFILEYCALLKKRNYKSIISPEHKNPQNYLNMSSIPGIIGKSTLATASISA